MTTRSPLRVLFAGLWLAVTILATACGADDLLDEFGSTEQPSGGVDCYQSFSSFKRTMERQGKKPPTGEQWHHIVEQNSTNQKRFPERLHCTDNLIKIPQPIHENISGHYSSKPKWTNGKTVREVISERSWQEQHEYGLDILRKNGINP